MLFRSRKKDETIRVFRARSGASDNSIFSDYNQMSDADLNAFINRARNDYLAWAGVTPGIGSVAPGTLASGDLSRIPAINVSETVRNTFIGIFASPDVIYTILRKVIKYTVAKGACRHERSIQSITGNIEVRHIYRNGVKVASREVARLGFKAPAKALTAASSRIASRLVVMGALAAAGPPGWAVEAAMFAFQATLGMMDQYGVGGYEELVSERMYAGMRDHIDREFEKYMRDEGYGWPVPYGPLNKFSKDEMEAGLAEESKKILEDENHAITKLITAIILELGTRLGREPTSDEIEDAFNKDTTNAREKLSEECYKNFAARNNAKMIRVGDDLRNSYLTREAAEASFRWPLQDEKVDFYVEWDDATQTSYLRSSKMREYAEGLGFGCTYDKVRRLPKVTEQYCLENGLYFDGQGKQCQYKSSGQQIAELIFGKAFVRGLLQVFDPDMYKKCSDMDWCKDGKCRDDGAYFCVKSTLSYSRPPVQRKCPDGTSETTPGFCNKDCPDGFFRMPGDQICYDSRTRGKALSYPARYKCSKDPFTYKLDPVETAATRCYNTWCKVKTGPHTRCTSKPAPCDNEAACWQSPVKSCDPGYTEVGGICYRISRPLETAKPKTGVEGIGVCPAGTSRKKTDDLCYAPCQDGFDDWPAGVCNSRSSTPKLEIKPKERKAPYGKTDFKNSPVGQRIQNIKDNIKQGDIGGVASGIGALYLQACPIVNGLGLQDLANMIPES